MTQTGFTPRIRPSVRNALLTMVPVFPLPPLANWIGGMGRNTIADSASNRVPAVVLMAGALLLWGLSISIRARWAPALWSWSIRRVMPLAVWWIVLVCFMPAVPAEAQTSRELISGARLAPGYAAMLNLAATPDFSTAHYDVGDHDPQLAIDVTRFGQEAKSFALSGDADLYWRGSGAYLRMRSEFPVNDALNGTGTIASKWSAYSVTGGPLAKIRFGRGFTLVPAVDVGLARLENRAGYEGAAKALQPALDGLLFNWHSNATVVTPNIGLEWVRAEAGYRTSIRSHVSWSWISSFDESDPILKFNETAGVYSIRVVHAAPSGLNLLERPLGWVLTSGYAGFFGPNRRALGFTSVAELGLGAQVPLLANAADSRYLRLGASYLFGPDVRGWTIGLGLQY